MKIDDTTKYLAATAIYRSKSDALYSKFEIHCLKVDSELCRAIEMLYERKRIWNVLIPFNLILPLPVYQN